MPGGCQVPVPRLFVCSVSARGLIDRLLTYMICSGVLLSANACLLLDVSARLSLDSYAMKVSCHTRLSAVVGLVGSVVGLFCRLFTCFNLHF